MVFTVFHTSEKGEIINDQGKREDNCRSKL